MSDTGTDAEAGDAPETTTIKLRVTESFLDDIDGAWKEAGYTSRSEFLRRAVRDAVERGQDVAPDGGVGRHRGTREAGRRD